MVQSGTRKQKTDRRMTRLRNLVVVFGDQLDEQSAVWDGFDPQQDAVWMAEVAEESTHVVSHKVRIALFLSAMRHFRDVLRDQGKTVIYRSLEDDDNSGSLAEEFKKTLRSLRPSRVIGVQAGEWRVDQAIQTVIQECGAVWEARPDHHFLCSREAFARHASGRKQLRMEFFYREMRREHRVLMDGDQPVGGNWNYDAENRQSFDSDGPSGLSMPIGFSPDAITREVFTQIEKRFPKHPGQLTHFDWPVTRSQARLVLEDFLKHRLPQFGRYQDAMWAPGTDSNAGVDLWSQEDRALGANPYLYHSRLSVALNLKLLTPREVVKAAEEAYRSGRAPLASVEGFIRQILGWREYVRGVYWQWMPAYVEWNALNADQPLPALYWTASTEMNCMRHVVQQVLDFGYAHHIQRLMVTGLFALLLGVRPREVHEWYLALFVDAVEWVELPNTMGMSQHADGGRMASKPYIASGNYIQRMSNYCDGCRYRASRAVGADACPFTTLYWDFLMRHEAFLAKNPRMTMQIRNLRRLSAQDRGDIQRQADQVRRTVTNQ